MFAGPAPTNPIFPYVCTPILNMDTLVPFFTVQAREADRRARLVRPSTASEQVYIAVETVAESLGRLPVNMVAQIGTPLTGLSLTSFVDQDIPVQFLVNDRALGALDLGAQPTTVVSTTPVGVQWSQAPAEFPPPLYAGSAAWRLVPSCRVPRTPRLYTGVSYAVVDNTVSANQLRALPVEGAVAGTAVMFALAWCAPSCATGFPVTLTLAWPGNTSPPASRTEFCPVKPVRCPRPRCPLGGPPPQDDPVDRPQCGDKPVLRTMVPLTDPFRIPTRVTMDGAPRRRRKCIGPF